MYIHVSEHVCKHVQTIVLDWKELACRNVITEYADRVHWYTDVLGTPTHTHVLVPHICTHVLGTPRHTHVLGTHTFFLGTHAWAHVLGTHTCAHVLKLGTYTNALMC